MNAVATELLFNRQQLQTRRLLSRSSPCVAYILSIDVRRSSALMLKAHEPWMYAEFMLTLAEDLRRIIIENYGLLDKFTGDGVLALFPDFYSGDDAGFFALETARECHEAFAAHYAASRSSFNSVLKDVGLGIGIDYGPVEMVSLNGCMTALGAPVVYACRMAGAPARRTYVNQPAHDRLLHRYGVHYDFQEVDVDVKGDGLTVAYMPATDLHLIEPVHPDWATELIESTSA